MAIRFSPLAGTITVSQQLIQVDGVPRITNPKTAKSHRTIAIGNGTVESLRQHRARQAAERLAAEDWVDTGLVFTKPDGQWIRPDRIYVTLHRLVDQAGVPWIGVHGLRHTMASLALQNGTDIATVSQRLGHSDTSVTTRVYLHGSEETDRAAAEALEIALS